jgi:hypothetical protein
MPVVGDWTGQKSSAGFPIDTVGMYDPKTCTWFLRNELTTGIADITIGYGPPGAGWQPIVGDWDGNGTTTVGLYNPANGYFYLHNSNTTGVGEISFFYGDPTQNWIPVAGDWTGSGHNSIGMYDPATCTWYLRNELSTGVADITFGFGAAGAGWLPVVGDWGGAPGPQALAAGSALVTATASAPLSQADFIDPTPAADVEFARLGSGTQVQAIDSQAVDQLAGLGGLDTPATSTVSGLLPTGVRRNVSPGEIDAIFAQGPV